jgi:muramoyltetrapeptide carboxypeptidase
MQRILIILSAVLVCSSAFASKKWQHLEDGEPFEVIAPGYGVQPETMDQIRKHLQTATVTPNIPSDLIATQPFSFANTVEYRVEHLRQFFRSKSKVAWCLRGGRGGSALVEQFDVNAAPEAPKLIVGFSDATALHLLTVRWGWPFLHAPVLAYNLEVSPQSVNKGTSLQVVINILTGRVKEVEHSLIPVNKTGKTFAAAIDSSIVGGNMSAIQRSIGTSTQLNTAERLLLLEDIGEDPKKALEVLTQFERVGMYKYVKGVILGNFTSTFNDAAIIAEYLLLFDHVGAVLDRNNVPLFKSDCFGHGPFNDPLPLNTPARLSLLNAETAKLLVRTNN